MKHLSFALFLFVSLWVAGCAGRRSRNLVLCRAEHLVYTDPHGVLILLDSLSGPLSRSDSMCMALLTAEACLAQGLSLADDSAVNRVASYYHAVDDRQRYARALLCRGVNAYCYGYQMRALRDVLDARDASGSDRRLRQRAAYALGLINLTASCLPQAAAAFKEASKLADDLDMGVDTRTLSRCKLAQTYDRQGLRDSFSLCMAAIASAESRLSPDVRVEASLTLSLYDMRIGRSDRAGTRLQKINDIDLTRRSSYLLGNLYARQGRVKDAVREWFDASMSGLYDVRLASLDSLISHRPADRFVVSLYVKEARKLSSRAYGSEIAALQTARLQETARRHTYRVALAGLSVIVVLLLVLCVFIVYHRRTVNLFRRHLSTVNRRYMHDIEAYNRARADVVTLQRRIAAYQDDHATQTFWDMEEMLLTEPVVLALHASASRGRTATDGQWVDLRRILTRRDPRLAALLARHDGLNAKEVNVCMLVRLRFIPSELSALLAMTPQAVTNVRVRLLQKLFDEKGGARRFDELMRKC